MMEFRSSLTMHSPVHLQSTTWAKAGAAAWAAWAGKRRLSAAIGGGGEASPCEGASYVNQKVDQSTSLAPLSGWPMP